MAEEYIPISKARAEIAKCANLAQTQMRRYVLTTQGDPKVVLLGYEDYRTLKATASLARRQKSSGTSAMEWLIFVRARRSRSQSLNGKRNSPLNKPETGFSSSQIHLDTSHTRT